MKNYCKIKISNVIFGKQDKFVWKTHHYYNLVMLIISQLITICCIKVGNFFSDSLYPEENLNSIGRLHNMLNMKVSNKRYIELSGVHQGFNLELLFFLFHINDNFYWRLPSNLKMMSNWFSKKLLNVNTAPLIIFGQRYFKK